jgi:hypothetical protein
MGYLASPLADGATLVGIVLVLQSHYIRPEYSHQGILPVSAWPRSSTMTARCRFD